MTEQSKFLPGNWAARLEATPQNPEYHAEGNVLNHTRMVASEVEHTIQMLSLDHRQSMILRWAAWLHDIGKPLVTKEIDGKWRAPWHEAAGVPIARDILIAHSDLSPQDRQTVLDLVRFHYGPYRWMLEERPFQHFRQSWLRYDLRLLGIFARCDFKGRISRDAATPLSLIESFNEQIVGRIRYEWNSFSAIQEFYNGSTLRQRNALWNAASMGNHNLVGKLLQAKDDQPQLEVRSEVVVSMAPPGTDISARAASLFPDHFYVRLSDYELQDEIGKDEFFVHRKLNEFRTYFNIYIRTQPKIFVEGNLTDPSHRKLILTALRQLPVLLTLFHTVPESGVAASNLGISQEAVWQEWASIMPPHPWEAHALIWD